MALTISPATDGTALLAGRELLTEREVAAVFRVTPRTVRRWARAGTLDAVRPANRTTRYRAADVARLIDHPLTSIAPAGNEGDAKTDGQGVGHEQP